MNSISIEINDKTYSVQKDFETVTRVEARMGVGCLGIATRINELQFSMTEWVVLLHSLIDNGKDGVPSQKEIGTAIVSGGAQVYQTPISMFLMGIYLGHKDEVLFEGEVGNVPSAT